MKIFFVFLGEKWIKFDDENDNTSWCKYTNGMVPAEEVHMAFWSRLGARYLLKSSSKELKKNCSMIDKLLKPIKCHLDNSG